MIVLVWDDFSHGDDLVDSLVHPDVVGFQGYTCGTELRP